jgi:hypothetical protein
MCDQFNKQQQAEEPLVARTFAQSHGINKRTSKARGGSGTRDLCRQREDSEVLTSEVAEACFALPLREAAAHFACRNARSVEAEMVGFDDGAAATQASTHCLLASLCCLLHPESLFSQRTALQGLN